MGRGSKFGFPRAGRRTAEVPAIVPTPQYKSQHSTTQVYDSSSKAQRLLGTSEIPGYRAPLANAAQPAVPKPRNSNVPIPEENTDEDGDGNNGEIQIAFDAREHSPRPSGVSQTLRPFSPQVHPPEGHSYTKSVEVAGDFFAENKCTTNHGVLLDPMIAPQFFQRKLSAPSVGNQASAGGIIPEQQARLGMTLPNRSCVSDMNPERKKVPGSVETKSRPSRLDISRLFPRPSSHRAASPSASVDERASQISSSKTERPRPLPSLAAKHDRSYNNAMNSSRQRVPHAKHSMPNLVGSGKNRTTDSQRSNSKNWFDGYNVDGDSEGDEENDALTQQEIITQSFPEPPLSSRTSDVYSSRGSWKSSIGSKGYYYRDSGHSAFSRPLASAPGTYDSRFAPASLAPYPSDAQSVRSFSSRQTQTSSKSGSKMMNSDLNKQSVLSFSSSEDEDEDGDDSTPPSLDFDTSTRDSYEDDNHRLPDHTAIEDTAGPSLDQIRARQHHQSFASSSGRSSTTIGNSEAFGSESSTTPRNSHHLTRMYSSASSKFSVPSTIGARSSQAPSLRESIRSTSTTSTARQSEIEYLLQLRQDRLMAVTPEEEALLEAMRTKRTRMHKENAEQRQRSAVRSRKTTISPVPEDRVSILSDATTFPSPPRHGRSKPRSRERRPPALSSEALKRAPNDKFLPTPKVSPTLHFDMSKLLLSSRDSVTLPSTQEEAQEDEKDTASTEQASAVVPQSTSRPTYLGDDIKRPSRTRTASSSCVTDGAEKNDISERANEAASV